MGKGKSKAKKIGTMSASGMGGLEGIGAGGIAPASGTLDMPEIPPTEMGLVSAEAVIASNDFYIKSPSIASKLAGTVAKLPKKTGMKISKAKGISHPGMADPDSLKVVINPAYPKKSRFIEEVAEQTTDDFSELNQDQQETVEEAEEELEEEQPTQLTIEDKPEEKQEEKSEEKSFLKSFIGFTMQKIQSLKEKAKSSVASGNANTKMDGKSSFTKKANDFHSVIKHVQTIGKTLPVIGEEKFKALKFNHAGSAGHIGGGHEKHFYTDNEGKKWLFKPDKHSGGTVAEVEAAVSKITRMVGQPCVEVFTTNLNGKAGSIQPFVEDAKDKKLGDDPTKFTPGQIRALVREHVISWATSEYDANHTNFIMVGDEKNGAVAGIDKAQSFKYFGKDKLSLDYISPENHPNKSWGTAAPIYYNLYTAAKDGKIKMNPYEALEVVKKFESIPDDQYKAVLRPVAEKGAKNKVHWYETAKQSAEKRLGKSSVSDMEVAEEFLTLAVERKKNLRKDFGQFFGSVFGDGFNKKLWE